MYYADIVYHHRPFPWEDGRSAQRGAVLRGSADLNLVRDTMLRGRPHAWATPLSPSSNINNNIVLIERRGRGGANTAARRSANHDALLRALRARWQNVVVFSEPAKLLRDDIELFRGARAVCCLSCYRW